MLKNSHLKTMKIIHEEKTTESDKKPPFQLNMLMLVRAELCQ